MPSIDLHCHSLYSDGTQTPQQLVQQAIAAGVEVLALTDHDTVLGLAEAHLAAQQTSLNIIDGVEISAIWQTQLVHIIGLNINPLQPSLQAGLQQQAQARAKRAMLIAQKFDSLSIKDTWPAVLALADNNPNRVGRAHFAQVLVERGLVNAQQKAFDKYLGTGKPANVSLPWTDMNTAIEWIVAAGGVAVLAHPARYGLSQTKLRALLADFKAAGGQAMEVSTANEKSNIVQNLANLAQRFELYASQGSDYHGTNMTWLQLGRFAPLPTQCQPVWQLFKEKVA
ncbi:MAG: PHP domain-containing protein [Moraxellaceae bacterium]|nr:PHP domain-containing protein [Moraxellaceae bacterium]MCP5176184.1 PHP domain-containing protein [Moraxellaceae bacterium]